MGANASQYFTLNLAKVINCADEEPVMHAGVKGRQRAAC